MFAVLAHEPPAGRRLVVMGKLPRAGAVKTRLCPPLSPDQACAIYAAMLADVFALCERAARFGEGALECLFACALPPDEDEDTARALAPTGWRVGRQHGVDLGARIMQQVEAARGRHVVIIGADAPTMPERAIPQAFAALDAGAPAVFGPSADGGYYLVGLPGQRPELFADIPWSTPAVMETTRVRARSAQIALTELEMAHDIDVIADLEGAVIQARAAGWQRFFVDRYATMNVAKTP